MSTSVAIVTGGGSGIGLAFTQLLHSEGYSVIIADLRLHAHASTWIDSLKAQDASGLTQRIVFQETDVTKRQQLEAVFDRCEREFGTCPDVVVPGAGVYEPSTMSFWDDNDEGDGYKILDINLVHPIKISRIAIRRMLKAGKPGTIACISSIAGQRSTMVTPLYTVSKHGINSFVRGMAGLYDLAGIRVVAVAPGCVQCCNHFTAHYAHKCRQYGKDTIVYRASRSNAFHRTRRRFLTST